MDKGNPLIEFVLKDRVGGVEISPDTINLPDFNEFNQQVQAFITGSEHLELDAVRVGVSKGSYKLTAILTLLVASALESDLKALERPDSLGEIDPKRADVIAKWQSRTKNSPDRKIEIRPLGIKAKPIALNAMTDYRIGQIVPWVRVEKYLFGTVTNMGGAQKANVHIRLDGTDQVVIVGTNQDYLKEQERNRLYKKVLVRVQADQNHRTGELRALRLISFEDYEPKLDEKAMDRFAEEGRKAWKDVASAGKWVRQLRGGD
jgi:hypothetical protein